MTSRDRYAFKRDNRYIFGPISGGINRLSRATPAKYCSGIDSIESKLKNSALSRAE